MTLIWPLYFCFVSDWDPHSGFWHWQWCRSDCCGEIWPHPAIYSGYSDQWGHVWGGTWHDLRSTSGKYKGTGICTFVSHLVICVTTSQCYVSKSSRSNSDDHMPVDEIYLFIQRYSAHLFICLRESWQLIWGLGARRLTGTQSSNELQWLP